jgi:hypothetical protein
MAVMANSDSADEVVLAVLAAADHHHGGDRSARQPTEVAGTYRVRDGYTIEITDDLTLHAPGQPPLQLHTLPDGRLRAIALDCELTFPDGDVLQLRQQGMTLTATRQES